MISAPGSSRRKTLINPVVCTGMRNFFISFKQNFDVKPECSPSKQIFTDQHRITLIHSAKDEKYFNENIKPFLPKEETGSSLMDVPYFISTEIIFWQYKEDVLLGPLASSHMVLLCCASVEQFQLLAAKGCKKHREKICVLVENETIEAAAKAQGFKTILHPRLLGEVDMGYVAQIIRSNFTDRRCSFDFFV